MKCLHCSASTRHLSFREFWSEMWKADPFVMLCMLLSIFAALPILVAAWSFMTRCDQCGGMNLNVFGRWQRYEPPR